MLEAVPATLLAGDGDGRQELQLDERAPPPWQASQRPPATLNEKRDPAAQPRICDSGRLGEEVADRIEKAPE